MSSYSPINDVSKDKPLNTNDHSSLVIGNKCAWCGSLGEVKLNNITSGFYNDTDLTKPDVLFFGMLGNNPQYLEIGGNTSNEVSPVGSLSSHGFTSICNDNADNVVGSRSVIIGQGSADYFNQQTFGTDNTVIKTATPKVIPRIEGYANIYGTVTPSSNNLIVGSSIAPIESLRSSGHIIECPNYNYLSQVNNSLLLRSSPSAIEGEYIEKQADENKILDAVQKMLAPIIEKMDRMFELFFPQNEYDNLAVQKNSRSSTVESTRSSAPGQRHQINETVMNYELGKEIRANNIAAARAGGKMRQDDASGNWADCFAEALKIASNNPGKHSAKGLASLVKDRIKSDDNKLTFPKKIKPEAFVDTFRKILGKAEQISPLLLKQS